MEKTHNAKQRWAARHVQIKITVSPELAAEFKARCSAEGVSMTSKLKSFMSGSHDVKMPVGPYNTRQKRRKAAVMMCHEGDEIIKAEMYYRDRIPENLQSGPMYEAAENSIEALQDAMERLKDAYDS